MLSDEFKANNTEEKIMERAEAEIKTSKVTMKREITLLTNRIAELEQEQAEADEMYHHVLSSQETAIETIKVLQLLIGEKLGDYSCIHQLKTLQALVMERLDYMITATEVRGG